MEPIFRLGLEEEGGSQREKSQAIFMALIRI
jgi:hypothetical protein